MDIFKISIQDNFEAKNILKELLGLAEKSITLYFTGFQSTPRDLVKKVLLQRLKGTTEISFPHDPESQFGFATFNNETFANAAIKNGFNLYHKNQKLVLNFKPKRSGEKRKREDSKSTNSGQKKLKRVEPGTIENETKEKTPKDLAHSSGVVGSGTPNAGSTSTPLDEKFQTLSTS